MYNGIGLQTPRGSGTSGHIQSNFAATVNKNRSKDEFLKELEAKRNAVQPPPRKANEEIIDHERKRDILIQTLKLRNKLEAEGQDEIQQNIKKAEELLREKFAKGELQTQAKDTHVLTQAKSREYAKLSEAFGLSSDIKRGAAFDFQGQRGERLKRLEEKRLKPKIQCPHSECQKSYDSKERLERHLKYKHPKQTATKAEC